MSDSAQESQKRHFSKIRPHVLVRDKNLRPRGGKPVSAYPPEDREGLMLEAVREIDEIARKIMARKSAAPQRETSEVAITEVVRLVKYSISPVRQPNPDNRNAIVLVHGFSGSDWMSWRNLAPRIASDPRLGSWDRLESHLSQRLGA
jgi:hypothetical protein